MTIMDLLKELVERDGSDLHIIAGLPPALRVDGRLVPLDEHGRLSGEQTEELIGTLLSDRKPVAGMEVSAARRTPSPFLVPETDLSDPSNSLALPGFGETEGRTSGSRRDEWHEPAVQEEILAVTDPEGRFGLHAMKSGEYRLYFTLPGGERYSPEDFRVVLEPDSFVETGDRVVEMLVDAARAWRMPASTRPTPGRWTSSAGRSSRRSSSSATASVSVASRLPGLPRPGATPPSSKPR